MKILSVDSSSTVATCAVVSENGVLGEFTLANKREHSVILMELIQDVLERCSLDINDIDGFVVSKGPGSFTGLRIGMATIKGLSFGSNKPYVSVSTLDALAYSVSHFDGIICPVMDALRDSVYTSIYKGHNCELEQIVEPTAMDLIDLAKFLNEKNEKVIFIGEGLEKHEAYLKEKVKNAYFAPKHLSLIRSASLGEMGLKLLEKGIYDDENSSPLYIKKPQAERELEKRLGMSNEN
ncbi:MAG: tRNA (adenosine(37)-N6)-threonylcarbamoyltransferase complex dimerization subunit type 1 TsaB [Clostridium sp.]